MLIPHEYDYADLMKTVNLIIFVLMKMRTVKFFTPFLITYGVKPNALGEIMQGFKTCTFFLFGANLLAVTQLLANHTAY